MPSPYGNIIDSGGALAESDDNRRRIRRNAAAMAPATVASAEEGGVFRFPSVVDGPSIEDTSQRAAPAAPAASTSGGRRGSSDGGRGDIYRAVMEAAQELAARSQIPGVCEAAALVSILVNLVADSRSNAEGAGAKLKQCRSIIRMLQRAARVVGKGGGSTRNESECEMIEDVHEAVADLVDIIKVYQSKSKISQVLMSKMFKRRQEEAEAVVDRAIWRLNLNLHVDVEQKLQEMGEHVKEGLRLQAVQASKDAVVAGPISDPLAEARRVRRQRNLELIQIPEDHVIITDDILGTGAFGKVYIADYNGRNAAAKVMNVTHDFAGPGDLDSDDDGVGERKQGTSKSEQTKLQRRAFLRELDTMMRLKSRHTVNVYGAMMSRGGRLVLVMELLAGGDLRTFLRNSVDPLSETRVRRIIGDVCAGMAFLHSRQAVHGDLKSANVLLDGEGRAKIGDFGTSKWARHTNSTGLVTCTTSEMQGGKTSFAWAAPEVLETKGNSFASDVYSFGIVAWEVITRQLPWADQPLDRDIFVRVVMCEERPAIPADCPSGIAGVIRACWADLPADRPTFHELVKGMNSIG